jgi:phosphatidylglycerophosphate synthase
MLKANLRSEQTDKLLVGLAALGLSPNAWTLLSLVPAIAGMAALAMHHLGVGLILFALSGFIDMVDGSVARATGQVSLRGAYVDGVVDRYVELFTCLGLLLYLGRTEFLSLPSEAWFVLLIFGSIMTSFVRAYADHRGLVKDPGVLKRMGGLLERLERLMLLYIGMLLGLFDPRWLLIVIAITAVLANATALQRIWFVVKR